MTDRKALVTGGARRVGRAIVERLAVDLLRPDLRQLLLADQANYLCNDIHNKVDRMSMAHGIESRVPFLDHHLVEYFRSKQIIAAKERTARTRDEMALVSDEKKRLADEEKKRKDDEKNAAIEAKRLEAEGKKLEEEQKKEAARLAAEAAKQPAPSNEPSRRVIRPGETPPPSQNVAATTPPPSNTNTTPPPSSNPQPYGSNTAPANNTPPPAGTQPKNQAR